MRAGDCVAVQCEDNLAGIVSRRVGPNPFGKILKSDLDRVAQTALVAIPWRIVRAVARCAFQDQVNVPNRRVSTLLASAGERRIRMAGNTAGA